MDTSLSSMVMVLVKETTSVSEWMILVSSAKRLNFLILEDSTMSLIYNKNMRGSSVEP